MCTAESGAAASPPDASDVVIIKLMFFSFSVANLVIFCSWVKHKPQSIVAGMKPTFI